MEVLNFISRVLILKILLEPGHPGTKWKNVSLFLLKPKDGCIELLAKCGSGTSGFMLPDDF